MESTIVFVTQYLAEQSLQLVIVFAVALIANRLLRNASAHCRYLLWCIVIAKCLTPPLFHMPVALLPADPPKSDVVLTVEPDIIESSVAQSPVAPATSTPDATDVALSDSLPQTDQLDLATADRKNPSVAEVTNAGIVTPSIADLGLRGWLAMGWMIIAGSLAIFILVKMLVTHWRLRKSRVRIDDDTDRLVLDVVSRLRMRILPRVYCIEGDTQPFVWGWLRGDVYLTNAFLSATTRPQQKAILAHELAHVARWDVAINLIQAFTSAAFFFHPLVWIANKKIRQEREKCCDEIALSGKTPHAELYCETIVDLLASEFQGRSVPGLAVTGSVRNIEERINTILTTKRDFLRRPSRRALVLACVSAACLLPTAWVPTSRAAIPQAEEPVVGWEKGQVVHVTVVHAKTNAPISGVRLTTQFVGEGIDFSTFETRETNADGLTTLSLPDLPTKSMRIYPSKKGLLPLRCYWEGEPVMKNPQTVTIRMSDGNSIGGFVRDEAGAPIANVEMKIQYWGPGEGENPHLRPNITWNNPVCKMPKTDKDGKWQFDMMPKEIDIDRLYIYLKHPDFVSDRPTRGYNPTPLAEKPPWQKLRSLTSQIVMRRGETVRGKVVDKAGKPIPSAKIFHSEHSWALPPEEPIAQCDENGFFRVASLVPIEPPGENDDYDLREPKGWGLTFEAKGYAPNFIKFTNAKRVQTVTLEPGKELRGQVVDEDGKPVEKAYISAGKWRGKSRKFRRTAKTDADGRFELADLPDDEIEYHVYKLGYMSIDHVMSPETKFHKITLEKPLTVKGKVVDAETGEPINKFTMVEGVDYDDGRAPDWFAHTKKLINNGEYQATFKQKGILWRVRVEADGYLPAESPNLDPEDASKRTVTLNFKMKRGDPIKGTVLGLDAKPLKNARVYLARQRMNLKGRKVTSVEQLDREFVTTDQDGRFAFPPEIEPFCFVVVHEDGLGMVTETGFAATEKITIKAWDEKNHQQQIIRRPTKGQSVSFPEELRYP